METTIVENSLTRLFVTPQLCLDLKNAGLPDNTPFRWKITGQEARIDTLLFDDDGYYRKARFEIDSINKPIRIPAYSIADVEAHLPSGLFTNKKDYGYEVSLGSIFEIDSKCAARLPDALALLLLEGLRKRVLLRPVNNLLTGKEAA